MTITAERKLKKAKIDVMRSTIPSLRLWSGIMSIGKTSICDKTPTAYTNGRDETYGRDFVERLPVAQLSFVCLHEAMHKGLRHLTVWRKLFDEDKQLANIACDYVVNRMIVAADPSESVVQFPRNPDGSRMGLYDKKYDGMSARQVFDLLKQEKKDNPDGGQGEGEGGGFDEHGWDDAQDIPKVEQDALQKEIEHAMRRGEAEAKRCGAGKGDIPAEIGQLLRPQINWKDALREFITQNCTVKDDTTYRRLNRRFHALDLIMPTTYGESLGHIVACADLSGSMWMGNPSDMKKVLSEFVGVVNQVNPEHVDLLYWDGEVTGHEEYKRGDYENIANAMRPKGGGGTDPRCVERYLRTNSIKPDCIIMFTDGHVFDQWGDNWPAPILWVICGNPSTTSKTGKTVHMQ
jgi:predicted metal-dependent peptidase